MNAAIDAVVAGGWPPVFAWVFDDLWASVRTASVGRLLDAHARAGRPPGAARVGPRRARRGRRAGMGAPHRRRSRERLPRAALDLDRVHRRVGRSRLHLRRAALAGAGRIFRNGWKTERLTGADTVRLLAAVRALPAPAGSALAWNFDILHWSGASSGPGIPRRSVSLEFIARDQDPARDEEPLLSCGPEDPLPALPERLEYIAKAIVAYGKHEWAATRYVTAGGTHPQSIGLSLFSRTCSGWNPSSCRKNAAASISAVAGTSPTISLSRIDTP